MTPQRERETPCEPAVTCEERYVVGPVGPTLRGEVLRYRGYRSSREVGRRWLMPPDGLVKAVLGFGAPVQVLDPANQRASVSAVSLADGPRTTMAVGRHTGSVHCILVLLTPLAAYRISGVPPGEWSGRAADLGELMGRDSERLTQRLHDCPDWHTRFVLLDRLLTARLGSGPEASPQVAWAWAELHRTRGLARIEALATMIGWSRRHLERRFVQQIGLPPKAIAQILRMQYALRLQLSGLRAAEAAALAGYHDQSHFSHTCKPMLGCSPQRFQQRCTSRLGTQAEHAAGRVIGVLVD